MSMKTRLARLEKRIGVPEDYPTLGEVVAEHRRLERWLKSINMTATEAMAAGRRPPDIGLRWDSLDLLVKAEQRIQAMRRELLGDDAGQGAVPGEEYRVGFPLGCKPARIKSGAVALA